MIRKVGSKWVLFTHDGSRRLGTHDSRKGAVEQEQAIKASEHDKKKKRRTILTG